MKIFRLFTMLMLGIMLNVNLTSCSKEDIVPDKEQGENNDGGEDGGQVEHPNGIPSNIPNNIIYYITSDKGIVRFQNGNVFGGAKIVSNTYSSTKGYGTIEFASEVTAIDQAAFKNQSILTYIVLPNSVKSIGEDAFSGCSGLTSVTIPNSVESIGKSAFYDCKGLTSVTIPNSVTSIGDGAFEKCTGLTSLTIGNSVESIERDAFAYCSGLTSVTIGNSVTSIGMQAFAYCSGLTSVTIGNGVKSIESEAFAFCSKLRDIYCYAEKVPSAYDRVGSAFDNFSIADATLYVPAASINSYRATYPWRYFGNIVALTE